MMNRKTAAPALLVLMGLASTASLAQLNTVKGGIVYYQTHAETTGVTGIGVPPGADADVGNATTVLVSFEREIAPNIGAELVLGWPPTIKADGAGSVAFLGEVLSAFLIPFIPGPVVGLVLLLAFLGWNPGTEQEIFSLEELINVFDPERIHKGEGILLRAVEFKTDSASTAEHLLLHHDRVRV